jgi:hypothetical protein
MQSIILSIFWLYLLYSCILVNILLIFCIMSAFFRISSAFSSGVNDSLFSLNDSLVLT